MYYGYETVDALNKLKLNDEKTEFVVIGTRQQLAKVNIDALRVGDANFDSVDGRTPPRWPTTSLISFPSLCV